MDICVFMLVSFLDLCIHIDVIVWIRVSVLIYRWICKKKQNTMHFLIKTRKWWMFICLTRLFVVFYGFHSIYCELAGSGTHFMVLLWKNWFSHNFLNTHSKLIVIKSIFPANSKLIAILHQSGFKGQYSSLTSSLNYIVWFGLDILDIRYFILVSITTFTQYDIWLWDVEDES